MNISEFQESCAVTAKIPDSLTDTLYGVLQEKIEDALKAAHEVSLECESLKRDLFYQEDTGKPSKQGAHLRTLHGVLGLLSELHEMYTVTPEGIEFHNIKEEVPDASWYLMEMCTGQGVVADTALTNIIKKLKSRHGDKFEAANLTTRDLEEEEEIIHGS